MPDAALTPQEKRFQERLRSFLERAGYREGVGTVNWAIAGNAIKGQFLSKSPIRIFDFELSDRGLSYGQSKGSAYRKGVQATLGTKRTLAVTRGDRKQCTGTASIPCGASCISDRKRCQVNDYQTRRATLALLGEAKSIERSRAVRRSQSTERVWTEQGRQAIAREGNKIRNLPYEQGVIVDPQTGEVVAASKGDKTSVSFTQQQTLAIRGRAITHNHPNAYNAPPDDPRAKGVSFSPADIQVACVYQAAEINAVSAGYDHKMEPPMGGWNGRYWRDKVAPSYSRQSAAVYNELVVKVWSGEISASQAEVDYHHLTWERVAAETGMKYTRNELSGRRRR